MISLKEIKSRDRTHLKKNLDDGNMRYNLWGRFVLKKLSYYPVWLFVKLSITANEITGLSFLMGCLGCFLIAFGGYATTITGAVLVNLWALLDYADGQVARLKKSGSNYGRFLDNLADTGMAVLLFVSLGMGAFGTTESLWLDKHTYLFLGCWTAVCYLYMLLVAYNYERLISPKLQSSVAGLKIEGLPKWLLPMLDFNLRNVTGLVMPVVMVGAICGFLDVVVVLWAVVTTVAVVGFSVLMIRKAGGKPDG